MSVPQTAKEIILGLPQRFKPDSAGGDNGMFHFIIEGEMGGDFSVLVEDGSCQVSEGLNGEPDCVIRSTSGDYEDAELGRVNKQMAVMMGKIKISDLVAMMKFMTMFDDIKVD